MADTNVVQETQPRQPPHHPKVLCFPQYQLLAPQTISAPHQNLPSSKHGINKQLSSLPCSATLHAGLQISERPPFYSQNSVQAIDLTKKDCSRNDVSNLYQIVPARPMVSRTGGIPICRIANPTSRQVTFSKRRNGLLKKAYELSVLCDVEVGLIIFSASGRLSEFASSCTSMPRLLERFEKYSTGLPYQDFLYQEVEFWRQQVLLLREQLLHHKKLESYMLGENLVLMDLNDMETLEHKIETALSKIRVQKAHILQTKAQESVIREARLKEENDMLKRKLYEVTSLHAFKERLFMMREAPTVRCLDGDVMGPSMHERIQLMGGDECPSASGSTIISQDMNPPKLQLGLELFPTCK